MIEWLREVMMVEVVGVVEVYQRLGHLPRPLLPLREKQLWLLELSNWSKGLLPWQDSSIDHIQEARFPHLTGEMISLIWLV